MKKRRRLFQNLRRSPGRRNGRCLADIARFLCCYSLVCAAPELLGDSFTVCVMNYEPETDISIYSSQEDITISLLEKDEAAYIHSGDYYIGVFTDTAELENVLDALRNIK